MKKALVLGASGGMGYSIVKELASRGIPTVAFARNETKLNRLFGNDKIVEIFSGDAFQSEDLWKASEGVEVVFHAINIPYYQWEKQQPDIIQNILQTVAERKIKLAIVDNIYAYGKHKETVTETTVKHPHTKKGKIRLELEEMVRQSEVPALIAHFPDFYGPNAESSFIHYLLKDVLINKKASFVGRLHIAREYIYTPDGAKALVELAVSEKSYGQNWNIPASGTISGNEVIKLVKSITSYDKRISTVTKNMIRFVGIFNPQMRELTEMMYLTEEPVVLNGAKYEDEFGHVPKTPYFDGLKETIEYMKLQK